MPNTWLYSSLKKWELLILTTSLNAKYLALFQEFEFEIESIDTFKCQILGFIHDSLLI